MNSKHKALVLAMAAGIVMSGGLAIAGSEHHDNAPGRVLHEPRSDASRWTVSAVGYDALGNLTLLKHVVPLSDMAVFGEVTTGLTQNGLKIIRAEAVFNANDTEVQVPHYHFTQWFSASR